MSKVSFCSVTHQPHGGPLALLCTLNSCWDPTSHMCHQHTSWGGVTVCFLEDNSHMLPQSTERQKQHLPTCGQPCPGQAQRRVETLTPDHSVGSTQQSRVAGVSLGLGSWRQALTSLLQLAEGDDCHVLCVWSQPPDSLPRLDPLTC